MLTNKDIDECLVMAELDVNDDIDDAIREFYRPDVDMEAEILWASLPESVKKAVKMRNAEFGMRN